jgi:nicotinamide riboside transporter PnuC
MADKNIWDPNHPPEEKQPVDNKPKGNIAIVGYNILVLAFYTILFKMLANQGGLVFDALVILIHFLACVIMAISNKSWMWLLSGVLIVVIGFSTCTALIGIDFK